MRKNYRIDMYGNPYIEDESWPAGGGLDSRCDFNATALHAYDNVGDFFDIEAYLKKEGFECKADNFPFMQKWSKGNTRIVFEDYMDGLWGYMYTDLVRTKKN